MGFCKRELTDCGNSFSDTFREKKERKIEMKAMAERFQKLGVVPVVVLENEIESA